MVEKPHDIDDPVAKSIRNQQARDAMPAEEPRPQPCDRCGEHPGQIHKPEFYIPDCSSIQSPPLSGTESLCERCYDPTTKEDRVDSLLSKHDYVVEYDCGILEGVDSDVSARWESPSVRLRHRCGETIATVHEGGDD